MLYFGDRDVSAVRTEWPARRGGLFCRISASFCQTPIVSPVTPPTGYHSVTPRVVVPDVAAQVEFLRRVFDATGEVEIDRPSEIDIGDSRVLVSGSTERELFPAFLYVYVDDADRTYERALDAGATSLEEPRQTPYGDRRAMIRDPFGNVFQIAHPLGES